MGIKNQIKSLLKQAKVYSEQGLLNEAKSIYIQAGKLMQKHKDRIKDQTLAVYISKKLNTLKEEINKVDTSSNTIPMPEAVQNIIKDKFSFAADDDSKALEGAVALAKFGQFERALEEFTNLIGRAAIRVDAAKNIIRCHKALNTVADSVENYHAWLQSDSFNYDQLVKLRVFLQNILDKKGMDVKLPQPEPPSSGKVTRIEPEPAVEEMVQEEEILDIGSVEITVSNGNSVEIDVSFQSGAVVNLLISKDEKDLIEFLKPDMKLEDVQFYSPIAMFKGRGTVVAMSKIESGPKQGDYSLDIEIKSLN